MVKLSDRIESVLEWSQQARDSDKELIIEIVQALGAELSPKQLEILGSISFESITRCRRKLQEEGKYPPSPEVAKQRRLKSYIVQQQAPNASPAQIQRITAEQPKVIYPTEVW